MKFTNQKLKIPEMNKTISKKAVDLIIDGKR